VKKQVYHLNLNKLQIRKSEIALLPGDPFRVVKIAALPLLCINTSDIHEQGFYIHFCVFPLFGKEG